MRASGTVGSGAENARGRGARPARISSTVAAVLSAGYLNSVTQAAGLVGRGALPRRRLLVCQQRRAGNSPPCQPAALSSGVRHEPWGCAPAPQSAI